MLSHAELPAQAGVGLDLGSGGPAIIAAVIAFVGVLLTIVVLNVREARREGWGRRNAYRVAASEVVSRLMSEAFTFERAGRVASEEWKWLSLGSVEGSSVARDAEQSMARMVQTLEEGHRIASEKDLVEAVDRLERAFHAAAGAVHAATGRVSGAGLDDGQLDRVWAEYCNARDALGDTASRVLRAKVKA